MSLTAPVISCSNGYSPIGTVPINVYNSNDNNGNITSLAFILFEGAVDCLANNFMNGNIRKNDLTVIDVSNCIAYIDRPADSSYEYCIAKLFFSDGNSTAWSEPLQILNPPITAVAYAAVRSSPTEGYVVIEDYSITRCVAELAPSYYNIPTQYFTDTAGDLVFDVQEKIVPNDYFYEEGYLFLRVDLSDNVITSAAVQSVIEYTDESLCTTSNELSNTVYFEAQATPATPTIISVTNEIGSIQIIWEPGPFAFLVPISGYNIYQQINGEGPYIKIAYVPGADSTTYNTDSELQVGDRYCYEVTAVTGGEGGDESAHSEPKCTIYAVRASAPTNTEAEGANRSLYFSFKNPISTGGGEGRYFVCELYEQQPDTSYDLKYTTPAELFPNLEYNPDDATVYDITFSLATTGTLLANGTSYGVKAYLVTEISDGVFLDGFKSDLVTATPSGVPIIFDRSLEKVGIFDRKLVFSVNSNNSSGYIGEEGQYALFDISPQVLPSYVDFVFPVSPATTSSGDEYEISLIDNPYWAVEGSKTFRVELTPNVTTPSDVWFIEDYTINASNVTGIGFVISKLDN